MILNTHFLLVRTHPTESQKISKLTELLTGNAQRPAEH
jgi:hypothetical protein